MQAFRITRRFNDGSGISLGGPPFTGGLSGIRTVPVIPSKIDICITFSVIQQEISPVFPESIGFEVEQTLEAHACGFSL